MATVTQAQTNHVNSSATARPFLSISGSDAFCTGSSTYTIIGLLSGSTVLWSVSASNVVMFQPVGDDILLTQIGNGNITLSATVYNPGSSTPSVISKQVSVGTIRAADIIGMQPGTTLTAGQYLTLYVNESAQAYSWYIGEPPLSAVLQSCLLLLNWTNVTPDRLPTMILMLALVYKMDVVLAACILNTPMLYAAAVRNLNLE